MSVLILSMLLAFVHKQTWISLSRDDEGSRDLVDHSGGSFRFEQERSFFRSSLRKLALVNVSASETMVESSLTENMFELGLRMSNLQEISQDLTRLMKQLAYFPIKRASVICCNIAE